MRGITEDFDLFLVHLGFVSAAVQSATVSGESKAAETGRRLSGVRIREQKGGPT